MSDINSQNDRLVTVAQTAPKKKANPVLLIVLFLAGLCGGFSVSLLAGGVLKKLAGPPPQTVPSGLKAAEYLDLGKRYKAAGWTEQARDSLKRAMTLDHDRIGKQAELYLNAYLPRYPVPQEAVRKNIEGYNQMAVGQNDAAIATFKECINKYPTFEWPYGNLGYLYAKQGQMKEAKQTLNQSLAINPHYVNGWLHLADVDLKDNDIAGARNCMEKIRESDADSPLLKLLELQIAAKQQAK